MEKVNHMHAYEDSLNILNDAQFFKGFIFFSDFTADPEWVWWANPAPAMSVELTWISHYSDPVTAQL